ncbi:hypothetical protein Tcan_03042 [Toxocara canis]|uniref:Uncharacterized protein n=1 Tax=Toxocara canis TaxID=6265 RepID=A0A0B2VU52_TOXCA|nr:hypothetical protein Tcan_03042 [Toxocara canis]
MLNSPSFLAPLIPSANTATTANTDPTKTASSPVLTSPSRAREICAIDSSTSAVEIDD